MVYSTWGSRCDKVVFATDKLEEDMELPVMKIDITGRRNLWGKTKQSVVEAFKKYGDDIDWVFKVILPLQDENTNWKIIG